MKNKSYGNQLELQDLYVIGHLQNKKTIIETDIQSNYLNSYI